MSGRGPDEGSLPWSTYRLSCMAPTRETPHRSLQEHYSSAGLRYHVLIFNAAYCDNAGPICYSGRKAMLRGMY